VNPFPLSCVRRGAVVNRGRFMVGRGRCMVCRGRLMIGWGRCVVCGGRFVVDRLWFMVCRGRLVVDRLRFMIGRCWRMVRFLLWIVSSSLVGHLSLVSIVVVSSVLDMLDTAIRKLDRVGAANNIAIRCLSSPEVCLTVIISNSILIGVRLRGVFFLVVDRFWCMVHWFWLMVCRFWFMVGRFRCMVDRFWFMVDGLWCMVDRLWWGVDRLWDMVGWGRGVVHRGRGVIHWSRGVVGGGGMNSCMVHWDIVVAEAGMTV